MLPTERFERTAPQRQELFQPECPVYVHCACLSVDRRTGAVFAQARLVNRGAWAVERLRLTLTGFLRGIHRFENLGELKAHIDRDSEEARRLLADWKTEEK